MNKYFYFSKLSEKHTGVFTRDKRGKTLSRLGGQAHHSAIDYRDRTRDGTLSVRRLALVVLGGYLETTDPTQSSEPIL